MFVDVHSHVVPSGDDGAPSIREGAELCRLARAGGTRVLFATPHVHAGWDAYPLTRERERRFETAFPLVAAAAARAGLELRRGWEVFPTELRHRDPRDLALEGTGALLLEFPGWWLGLDEDGPLVLEGADRVTAAGLVPVVAHPERSRSLASGLAVAHELVARGCLLCANGDSALGRNGRAAEAAFWQLLDAGLLALVASDGHRRGRPPRLDDTQRLLARRYGAEAIAPLFDGSALPWRAERCSADAP